MKTQIYTISIERHKTRRELRRKAETVFNVVVAFIIAAGLLLCGMGLGSWLG